MRGLTSLLVCLSLLPFPAAQAAPSDVAAVLEATRNELRGPELLTRQKMTPEMRAVMKPVLSRAYDDAARAQGNLGRYRDAVETIRRAVTYQVDDGLLHLTAFKVHLQQGEWAAARAALAEADKRFAAEVDNVDGGQGSAAPLALAGYLTSRAEWASHNAHLALALKQPQEAARWQETACNYSRLSRLAEEVSGDQLPVAKARVLNYEEGLRQGKAMPEAFEQLSCSSVNAYDAMSALAARARAGLSVNGPAEKQRYALPDLESVSAANPVHLVLIERFLEGVPVSEERLLELLRGQEGGLLDNLDRECEAYYFSGMYARYVERDEKKARMWFEKAVETWSLGSYEYVLARLELGLPPRPVLPAAGTAGKKRPRS